MQWVRFDADLTDRVDEGYQAWKAQMPPDDPISTDCGTVLLEAEVCGG